MPKTRAQMKVLEEAVSSCSEPVTGNEEFQSQMQSTSTSPNNTLIPASNPPLANSSQLEADSGLEVSDANTMPCQIYASTICQSEDVNVAIHRSLSAQSLTILFSTSDSQNLSNLNQSESHNTHGHAKPNLWLHNDQSNDCVFKSSNPHPNYNPLNIIHDRLEHMTEHFCAGIINAEKKAKEGISDVQVWVQENVSDMARKQDQLKAALAEVRNQVITHLQVADSRLADHDQQISSLSQRLDDEVGSLVQHHNQLHKALNDFKQCTNDSADLALLAKQRCDHLEVIQKELLAPVQNDVKILGNNLFMVKENINVHEKQCSQSISDVKGDFINFKKWQTKSQCVQGEIENGLGDLSKRHELLEHEVDTCRKELEHLTNKVVKLHSNQEATSVDKFSVSRRSSIDSTYDHSNILKGSSNLTHLFSGSHSPSKVGSHSNFGELWSTQKHTYLHTQNPGVPSPVVFGNTFSVTATAVPQRGKFDYFPLTSHNISSSVCHGKSNVFNFAQSVPKVTIKSRRPPKAHNYAKAKKCSNSIDKKQLSPWVKVVHGLSDYDSESSSSAESSNSRKRARKVVKAKHHKQSITIPVIPSPVTPVAQPARHSGAAARIPEYDGSYDAVSFCNLVETAQLANGWDDNTLVTNIASKLKGPARDALVAVSLKKGLTSAHLLNTLKTKFGVDQHTFAAEATLLNKRQGKEQTLKVLAQEIEMLVTQAYPKADEATQADIAVDNFINAISNDQTRVHARMTQPKSMKEALAAASIIENCQKQDSSMHKVHKVMSVGKKKESVIDLTEQASFWKAKFEESERRQTSKPPNLYTNNNGSQSPRKKVFFDFSAAICYFCGKQGHFQRDCQARQRSFSGSPQGGFGNSYAPKGMFKGNSYSGNGGQANYRPQGNFGQGQSNGNNEWNHVKAIDNRNNGNGQVNHGDYEAGKEQTLLQKRVAQQWN